MSDVSPLMKWLDELARYFENRDTGGEDRAHWANVYNAENALKVKAALTASEAEVERLKVVLSKIAERTSWIGVPVDTEAASYLGQELQAIVFEAAAALTGEKP